MTNSTRFCKICGKEYPYCKTELKDGNIFRWQDVACCKEHGVEYFTLIAASRGEVPVVEEARVIVEEPDIVDPEIEDTFDEEEDLDDEEFDEDDEEDE